MSQAVPKDTNEDLSEEKKEAQEYVYKDDVSIHAATEIPDANELKLPLDHSGEADPEDEIKCSYSPERQADSGNKNNTTQSPRTDSGICSRVATSAELTDVADDQTLQEPHLDTMAEITDISSGSEHEVNDDVSFSLFQVFNAKYNLQQELMEEYKRIQPLLPRSIFKFVFTFLKITDYGYCLEGNESIATQK